MLKGILPAPAAQVALNHHQRWDGSGYPTRIDRVTGEELLPPSGRQIPVFARIAILADVYDAATSQRCYSGAKLPVQVLSEMRTGCQGFFDPAIEAAFLHTVPPFPIGQVVTLSNGIEAAVVDFSAQAPTRPKVQCLRTPTGQRFANPALEEIDLGLEADLAIVAVDGRDVRPFLPALEDDAGRPSATSPASDRRPGDGTDPPGAATSSVEAGSW
jgi:hypothetical protein